MELHERIRKARKDKGLTQAQVAEHFGIKPVSVTQWESGKSKPEVEKFPRLALLLEVPLGWLMNDPDHPLSIEELEAAGLDIRSEDVAAAILGPNRPKILGSKGAIREIDVRAGMGGGGTMEGREVRHDGNYADPVKEEAWHFPARFMREEIRAPESRVIVLETQGDSMAPTLLSGDRVVIDTGHTVPSPDGIYAVRDQYGFIVVKRLQTMRGGKIRIISDNKAHEPEDFGSDEIAPAGFFVVRKK